MVNHWLDCIANVRTHGTTGKIPREHFTQMEPAAMSAYFTPDLGHQGGHGATRKADKTGLISCLSNKYSVRMIYQRQEVTVQALEGCLLIYNPTTGEEIARHDLHFGKGKIIKSNHHYPDLSIKIYYLERLF